MAFALWPAAVAGFVAGVVLLGVLALARLAGLTRLDPTLLHAAFLRDDPAARAVGLAVFLVGVCALLAGSGYALAFWLLAVPRPDTWWGGALFGVAQALAVGAVLTMLPAVGDPERPEASLGPSRRMFGRNYGGATPVVLLGAHVVFGMVFGVLYAWLR